MPDSIVQDLVFGRVNVDFVQNAVEEIVTRTGEEVDTAHLALLQIFLRVKELKKRLLMP